MREPNLFFTLLLLLVPYTLHFQAHAAPADMSYGIRTLPKKPANGEGASSNRLLWEYFHVIVGRGAIVIGIAALFTGLKHLGERYGGENVHGLSWAMIIWFLIGALMVLYLEYRESQRRRDRFLGRGNWDLGDLEEEDSVDLFKS